MPFLAALSCGGTSKNSNEDGAPGSGGAPVGSSTGGQTTSGGSGGTSTSACADTDGDGLSDELEGAGQEYVVDEDWDLTPDCLDLDSDADGMPDAGEAALNAPCGVPRDTDGDGIPNFRDTDSDNDGVDDFDEVRKGMNPHLSNSDGDACDDFVEFRFGECDPANFVLQGQCYGTMPRGITIEARSDIPDNTSDLSTEVEAVAPGWDADIATLSIEAALVSPAAGGTITDGALVAVDPGATVTFYLTPNNGWEGDRQWVIRIVSESQGVVGESQVLWRNDLCPILK